jgi:hypothetical protein
MKHAPVKTFRTLININAAPDIFGEIERYFSIKLDKTMIENIFKDAEENQVAKKEYLIFQGNRKFLTKQLLISWTVDEYEPETIWIEIQNIKEKDFKHFSELVSC